MVGGSHDGFGHGWISLSLGRYFFVRLYSLLQTHNKVLIEPFSLLMQLLTWRWKPPAPGLHRWSPLHRLREAGAERRLSLTGAEYQSPVFMTFEVFCISRHQLANTQNYRFSAPRNSILGWLTGEHGGRRSLLDTRSTLNLITVLRTRYEYGVLSDITYPPVVPRGDIWNVSAKTLVLMETQSHDSGDMSQIGFWV
jgi:hypothetical protein